MSCPHQAAVLAGVLRDWLHRPIPACGEPPTVPTSIDRHFDELSDFLQHEGDQVLQLLRFCDRELARRFGGLRDAAMDVLEHDYDAITFDADSGEIHKALERAIQDLVQELIAVTLPSDDVQTFDLFRDYGSDVTNFTPAVDIMLGDITYRGVTKHFFRDQNDDRARLLHFLIQYAHHPLPKQQLIQLVHIAGATDDAFRSNVSRLKQVLTAAGPPFIELAGRIVNADYPKIEIGP